MALTLSELQSWADKLTAGFKHWQFNNKAQLAFLEDLSVIINDGIPANRAIDMMSEISTGLTQEVALSIAQKISEGQALADGMQEWFAPNVVEIIRVGEAGGALAQTLQSAVNMLSQKGVAIGAFVGAVSYPLMVVAMACVVIVYLNDSVFVQFKLIKPVDQWPSAGRQLIGLALMIKEWWYAVIIAIIVIAIIFKRLMSNYVGEFRAQLDNFPPFSFYRRFTSARFLETLGLLVANGVVFKSAIQIMQYQANPYLSYHLNKMEALLGMGKTNVGDVLDTGLISNADLMRLRIMAEVKGFEHGLIRMGVRGTEDATKTLKLIAKILGGALLAVGAMLILAIIRGIYLTGMSMST